MNSSMDNFNKLIKEMSTNETDDKDKLMGAVIKALISEFVDMLDYTFSVFNAVNRGIEAGIVTRSGLRFDVSVSVRGANKEELDKLTKDG